ncbi:pentatricopeptide repeat-containing protein At4g02750-like [Gastrolobium bilobum]|uniref:pentatricopeptide repeat-containing protein At4g02750-like n=1 Tax=Gastrolobium bilobum TaxID=150636 RepID=UPI002AB269CE|nr:pentatricopeptide repeat-containing protein At4g02750-like [Gastrolobium bilobum]
MLTNIVSLNPSSSSITRQRHSLLLFAIFFSTRDVYRANLNIAALSRSGNVDAARQLFDKMPTKDVVTWNSMLTGYWQNGFLQHSKALFYSMPLKNVVSWNSMIAACVQNDIVDDAFNYFAAMPEKNAASYNAMISGLVKFGRVKEAQKLFEEMPHPNVISYTAMIDGYARKEGGGGIRRARVLFDAMPRRNAVSWTVMISGLVDNGLCEEAWELFERMPQKNIVATTAMITGFCKQGKMEEARTLFEELPRRDRVSWNIMITGYAQNGRGEEALNLFSQMVRTGMQPDDLTFVSLFTACASLASFEEGRQAYALVIKHGFDSDLSLSNALVTMYSKCGGIVDSELAFGQISHPDVVSWNTIIAAFAQHGLYDKARSYFDQMVKFSVQPDGITFLSLLSACCRAGRVDESMNLFNLMVHNYGIPPRSEHYACLVDVTSRSGQLQRACEIIQEMPFDADSSIWGALLAACSVHLNVKLGELAAKRILNLDPYNSGAFVMLSNIYAAAGKWKDVNRVRVLMKEQGVKKQKAYSWMQIGNKFHCFVGGDPSHPNISDIHVALRRITLHMKGDPEEIFL